MLKGKNANNDNKTLKTFMFIFLVVIILSIIISNITVNNKKILKEINIDEYLNLFEKEEKSYIYIGSSKCGYCQKIEPIIKQLGKELSITINYLNITNFTQSDYQKLTQSDKMFEENWGTPVLLIIEKGKVILSKIGYAEYEVIKDFLLEKNK